MANLRLSKKTLPVIAAVIACVVGYFYIFRDNVVFPNLQGPEGTTLIAAALPTPMSAYADCTSTSAAVLLTAKESSWLGLAHGMKSIGVPFCVTDNPESAVKQKVVIGYPALNGVTLSQENQLLLESHVRRGGTLIGFAAEGTTMARVFGFGAATGSRKRTSIKFADTPLTREFLEDPREATLAIGDAKHPDTMLGSIGYTPMTEAPLAVFEDGSAAILQNHPGAGRAFAFGIDVPHFTLRAQNGRNDELAKNYANAYEPTVDVFLRLLRSIYRAGEPSAVTLHSVPDNAAVAVLITHDVDYNRSMINAVEYAEFERAQGVPATYFIQTKYVRDFNDEIFFNPDSLKYLQRLEALGMEVASHSVAHSRQFAKLDIGTGSEAYPAYQPFVRNTAKTTGVTVMGELRVSKFLLDHFLQQRVDSFRPGHLSHPPNLNEALVATGYRFSSSSSANSLLTNLPFQATYARGYQTELPLYEFPVTIEDEAKPKLGERLGSAVDITNRIARYGGTVNVLIHPDILGHKLEFLAGFIKEVKPIAWFGTVRSYGAWWRARDGVRIETNMFPKGAALKISSKENIGKLTLEVPEGWSLRTTAAAHQHGRRVIVEQLTTPLTLSFATRR